MKLGEDERHEERRGIFVGLADVRIQSTQGGYKHAEHGCKTCRMAWGQKWVHEDLFGGPQKVKTQNKNAFELPSNRRVCDACQYNDEIT